MTNSQVSHRIVLGLCTATVASLSFLTAPHSAQAATVQFTDLASFQSNTTGLTTIDFEGLAPAGSFTFYGSGGLTTNGVNFTTPAALFVVDSAYDPNYNFNSGAILSSQGGNTTITATLPSGVTAVGSDIMGLGSAPPFTIVLSTGETFNVNTLNRPNRQFTGFTSDTAISSISFSAINSVTQLDNFIFGTASAAPTAVPEPFTIIGTLVGGTAAIRMRKKLKANAS